MFGLPAPIFAQERQPERFASLRIARTPRMRSNCTTWNADGSPTLRTWPGSPPARRRTPPTGNCSAWRSPGTCVPNRAAAAARCLASTSSGRDTRALAALVQMLGRADEGDHDPALEDWKGLHERARGRRGVRGSPGRRAALAVGEAYLRRLIRDGRYDLARKLCAPGLRGGRARRGQRPLHGPHGPTGPDRQARASDRRADVDGKPVSLAELKGKVVLVDFWATWCPPCVASIPALDAMAQKYQDKGFVILGVNVNAMHENVQEARKALPGVRRFLVGHRVTWTNLLNGEGAGDFASAYGVEQIPANFLVGRDGKIVAVEQDGEALEQAVIRALGGPARRNLSSKEIPP